MDKHYFFQSYKWITVSKIADHKGGDKNMHHKTKFKIDKSGSSLVDVYD
jgi:hypothetical protein